ncbi:hypothetical protein CR513_18404, partial [Mucuna pruriens]
MTSDKENVVEHPSTSQLDQDTQAFSKEEMDRLRVLLNSLGPCALTMKGTNSFNIYDSIPQRIWILNSGVTNQLTPFLSYFTSYFKVSKKQLITIANGDYVPIVGSSNVQLQSSLFLHNVFHVPKLANNLISIHRLIQDWNCAVTFFRSHRTYNGEEIGIAKDQGGLYYLQRTKIGNNTNKEDLPSNRQPQKLGQLLKFGFTINVLDIHRLESVKSFNCDVFQFSKHHRATFSPSNNKSLIPFDLIHAYVWGPASNSISEAKWFVSFIDDCTCVT